MAEPADVGREATLTASVTPATTARADVTADRELPPVSPDRYRTEHEIARGGLGRISAAVDRQIGRRVAIKEILDVRGLTSERLARFVREALLTARLQHPGIVPVYDIALWPDGSPFYAMKLVDGRPLSKVIEDKRTHAERLALIPHVIALADAVAYAHERRIIHRDLKPSNILVGAFGETVVIDWGLAKDLAKKEADTGKDLTVAGAVMGTPGYMAPEQATGADVDERADVYAIGSILYHVFAGKPPYDGGTANEILRQVAAGAPPRIAERAPDLAADLVAIVDKAMARDPAARYPTAKELAADLKRFQAGQLVVAHRYSSAQRVSRFVRRHRAAVAVGATAVAALAVTGVVGMRRIVAERDDAEAARARASAAEIRETERADDLTLAHARDLVRTDPTGALSTLSTLSPSFSRWGVARTIAAEALSRDAPRVLRGTAPILANLAFTSDGKTVFAASDAPAVQRWDVATGALRPLPGHRERVFPVLLTHDGSTLVTGSLDREVRIWNLASGSSRVLATYSAIIAYVAISPDDKRLIVTETGPTSHVYDLATGKQIATYDTGVVFVPGKDELVFHDRDGSVRFGVRKLGMAQRSVPPAVTRDGRYVVFRGLDGSDLYAAEIATGVQRKLARASVTFAVSPDGGRIALGTEKGELFVWSLADGQETRLRGHDAPVRGLAWSHDGTQLASGDADGTARLWNVAAESWRDYKGHAGAIPAVAFSPDDKTLATASLDRTVRLWPIASSQREVVAQPPPGRELSVAAAGRLVLYGDGDGMMLADLADGTKRRLPGPVVELAMASPDRRHGIALDRSRHHYVMLDLATGERHDLGAEGALRAAAWTPDSHALALGFEDGTLTLSRGDGSDPHALAKPGSPVTALAFSPDGRRLAGGDSSFEVLVWNLASGEVRVVGRHTAPLAETAATLEWSPDGGWLASASNDQSVGLWNAATDKFTASHRDGLCLAVAFSPDGKQLASCCGPEGIQIRDLATGNDRVLFGQADACQSVMWSNDGARIVTAVVDQSARIWDVASGESRGMRLGDELRAASFLPDQQRLLVVSKTSAQIVKDDLPQTGEKLRAALVHEAAARQP